MLKGSSKQTMDEYYIDLETTNTSFLKMAILLKSKGVENAAFFLKTYNKKLIGLDPYDEELTDKDKLRVFNECAENRFYFIREVFRVSEPGTSTDIGGGIPFQLNRGNLAFMWAADLNISIYQIMPRQFGKTWGAIGDATWDYHFNKNIDILHFNKNQSDANDNLTRIKTAIGMLPAYMQHSSDDYIDTKEKKLVKNNEKFMKNTLGSSIRAMSSAGNESKADAIARGKTAVKIWYDEIAFIFFNKAIYEAATPAYEKASEKAIINGSPYGIVITTTPGDLCTPHGAFAYDFMKSCIVFDEGMYDLSAKKLFDIIQNTPDKKQFLFIQFHYWQLGKTDEWYAEVSKRLGDPVRARREYLLEWINSNGNSPFDPDHLEQIVEMARQRAMDVETIKINKYFNMNVYSSYFGSKPVIISIDVSSGLGRDSSAIVVINPETLQPMAVFKSNMITSEHFERLIIRLVTKYYPNSIVTIENNSIGRPLINHLLESPIRRNIYKERVKRKVEQGGMTTFTKTKKIDSIEYGHNVNSISRPLMMETLESLVLYNKGCVSIPEISEEINFMEYRNGRIQHSSATHDDVTMAYLGGLYVIRYGTGLKSKGIYYNLNIDQEEFECSYSPEDRALLMRAVEKTRVRNNRTKEEDILDFLMTEQQPIDSRDIRLKEEEELRRINNVLLGIDEDDIMDSPLKSISREASDILLKKNKSYFGLNDVADDSDEIPTIFGSSRSLWGD